MLTQYKSHSLDRHIATTWHLSPLMGNYVTPVPAQMRRGPRWFAGSADAIYQNLNLVYDERPDTICVFGADHIYRMDPRQMIDQHLASGAGVTVAGDARPDRRRPASSASSSRRPTATGSRRSARSPVAPSACPTRPDYVLASMGNYVFSADLLIEAVTTDADDARSKHDLGGNIIPMLVERGEACVWDFAASDVPGTTERDRAYWRDVGTLDAYYDAHMDLISVEPIFNLYNDEWPILTWHEPLPPAKFVFDEPGRVGQALNSLVCSGVVVSGGTVRRSIVSPGVRIHSHAEVDRRGAHARRRRRAGRRSSGTRSSTRTSASSPARKLGVDAEADRKRFVVSDGGVVVVGKGDTVEA